MSKRIITRSYINKTTGELVTKQYEYGKRGGDKSLTIVGKNGKIYMDRFTDLLENAPDRATRADIRATVHAFAKNHPDERLTLKSLVSRVETNKYKKMFINAGYDPEEAAKELGLSQVELFDKDNWDGEKFTNPLTGETLTFVFNYYGTVWVK